ncbi:hypothetical protein ACF0H5_005550 [Mactra antiquata]
MGELTSEQPMTDTTCDVADATPKQLLSRFYSLQEERVQGYQMFEEGFQAYLKGSPNYNFPLYRRLVHEITQSFNKISQDVLCIKSKFAEQNNLIPISEIMEKIQNAEKKKLEMTAKLQLLRQKSLDEPSETIQSEIEDIKQSLNETRDYLVEQMEELKYESEDIYTAESDLEVTESTTSADR